MKTYASSSSLKPAPWAFDRYGYSAERRSAFYSWAKRNALPMIKLGPKKIAFDEAAVLAWESRRTIGGVN